MGAAAIGWASTACAPVPAPTTLFSLGVAAGLHSDSEVVLWTRPDPLIDAGVSSLEWEVAPDPGFSTVVASGSAAVDTTADHTVKVLVGGLTPDRSYWYRFIAGSSSSPVGRARTLPAPGSSVDRMNLAYASCQAYANGYYASWRSIASQDVDAVLFLGDYIYESGLIQAFGTVRPETLADARTLDDYRAKYRLYKSDPDLQSAHAAHPFAPVWDDHEVLQQLGLDGVRHRSGPSGGRPAGLVRVPAGLADGRQPHLPGPPVGIARSDLHAGHPSVPRRAS